MNQNNNLKSYNFKLILGVLFAVFLILSLPLNFLTITYLNQSLTLKMFEIKGVPVAAFIIIFFIYSIFTKNKKMYYATAFLLILSFAYTGYAYLNLDKVINTAGTFTKEHVQFGEGMLFYTLSFIILLLDIFFPDNTQKLATTTNIKGITGQDINIEGQYILANYIYGLSKRPELFQKLTVIVKKPEENVTHIFIQNEEIEKIVLSLDNIISVSVKNRIIVSEQRPEVNGTMADMFLASALIGDIWGPHLAESKLFQSFKDYNKMSHTQVYDIEFNYLDNGLEQKLLFQTKVNPKIFLKENFKDKYQEI